MKARSAPVLAVVALVLLGGTTACGGSDDDHPNAASPSTASSASDKPSGSDASSSSSVAVTKNLPKDFPDDVHLVGDIGNAVAVSDTWTVNTTTDKSVKDALAAAGNELTSQGYKQQVKPQADAHRGSATYGDKDYYVQINAFKQKKHTRLIYLVGKP